MKGNSINPEKPKRGGDPPGDYQGTKNDCRSWTSAASQIGRTFVESALPHSLQTANAKLADLPVPQFTEISSTDSAQSELDILPDLIESAEYTGNESILTLGSLANRTRAKEVRLMMKDGSTLYALDNIEKNEKPGFNTNCFGFALTKGAFWVELRPFVTWLESQTMFSLCENNELPQPGSLLIWRDLDGNTAHAAILLDQGHVIMASGTHIYENGKQYCIEPVQKAWRNSGNAGGPEIWNFKSLGEP